MAKAAKYGEDDETEEAAELAGIDDKGDRALASLVVNFAVPDGMTATPGRNFSVAGLGVCSV